MAMCSRAWILSSKSSKDSPLMISSSLMTKGSPASTSSITLCIMHPALVISPSWPALWLRSIAWVPSKAPGNDGCKFMIRMFSASNGSKKSGDKINIHPAQTIKSGLECDGLEYGSLDLVGKLVQFHVSQHHDRGQQQGSWVGQTFTGDIWSRTVDGFEDGDLVTHVTGWGQTQATDQTGGQVGHDVTVQVWHDHDQVVVLSRVADQLQRGVVQVFKAQFDVWVFRGQILGDAYEQTVGQLADRRLVHDQKLVSVGGDGVLEGVSDDLFGGLSGDQLDGLDNAWNDHVLDTGVLTFGVLSDQDGVDVLVWSLVTDNRLTWSDVGKQVEGPSQGQVQRAVTLSDWSGQWTLQCDQVLVDGLDSWFWDGGLAVDEQRRDIGQLPFDWYLGCRVDLLDGFRDLDTDTVTLDQGDRVVTVGVLAPLEFGHIRRVGSEGLAHR